MGLWCKCQIVFQIFFMFVKKTRGEGLLLRFLAREDECVFGGGSWGRSGGSDGVVFLGGVHADGLATAIFDFESHDAIDQCEERVIAAHADVDSGMELGSELADKDISGDHSLAARFFEAAPLASAIATVSGTTTTFFCSHKSELLPRGLWGAVGGLKRRIVM